MSSPFIVPSLTSNPNGVALPSRLTPLKEQSQATWAASGANASASTVFFVDGLGCNTNEFEIYLPSAPSTLSISIQGYMRGGTPVGTATTYTGTTSTVLAPSGYADYWGVTVTWTGGSTGFFVAVNRTGLNT